MSVDGMSGYPKADQTWRANFTRLVGFVMVSVVLGFGLLAHWLVPGDPLAQSLSKALAGADEVAPFGYDHLGRSLYHRLASALNLSLMIAAAAALTAGLFGLTAGTFAASRGGWVDRSLCTLADAFMALPGLLLVLLVLAIVPGTAMGFWVGLSLVLWVEFFRLTRASARVILASPAVQASRMLGFGPIYIFQHHVWPEIAPMLLTAAAFGAATAVMTIAALGYVSVGMRAPTPELGLMMVELLPYWREAPSALAGPVTAIFILLLGLHLVAGGKR